MIRQHVTDLLLYARNIRRTKFFNVFVLDVLSKGADFILLPVYLKILSQEEYGFYTYFLYVVVTAGSLISLGLNNSVSKMYYETDKFNRGTMLFSLNSMPILLFLLLAFIGFLSGLDIPLVSGLLGISIVDYNSIRPFFCLYILFNLLQTMLNVFFVISDNAIKYQKYNLIRTISGNLVTILLLISIAHGNKAYFRIYIEPVMYFIAFSPLIMFFFRKLTFRLDLKAMKHGLLVGLPMLGTMIVAVIYNISDKYFLQQSYGFDSLAIYNLAIFLTLPVSLIFSSFNTVWLPRFFQEKSGKINLTKSNSYLYLLSLLFLVIFLFMLLVLVIAIKTGLIDLKYLQVLYIFPIIYFSKAADALVQLYNNFVIQWGKTMFNLVTSICFGVLIFFLNYGIIPIWGIYGAACILLFISMTRMAVFSTYVKYRVRQH